MGFMDKLLGNTSEAKLKKLALMGEYEEPDGVEAGAIGKKDKRA